MGELILELSTLVPYVVVLVFLNPGSFDLISSRDGRNDRLHVASIRIGDTNI